MIDQDLAFELITPLIDGEASQEEIKAFTKFLQNHYENSDHIIQTFLEFVYIKKYLAEHYEKAKAPPSLYKFLGEFW